MMRTIRSIIIYALVIFTPVILAWLLYPAYISRQQLNIDSKPSIVEFNNVDEDIDISIIFPAFNEEARITSTLESTMSHIRASLDLQKIRYEIVVVDDGSTDNTVAISRDFLSKVSENSVSSKIVQLDRNRGKGGAVKVGVEYSMGKYILMADADGATDINDLSKLYQQIKQIERYDDTLNAMVGISIGSRAHLEKKSIATRAWYRTILMHGFHILVMIFCTNKVRDTQCGFKLFTKSAAKKLFSNIHLERWAFDIEIIYIAEVLGFPLSEVAVNWVEVPGSKLIRTKLDVITTSLEMARDIVCVRMAYMLGLWKIDKD